jgi:hypothetical protein
LDTGFAGAFVSGLRAEAAGAALPRADGFDFAAVFLDFATALAMADDNPKRGRRCAPYTTLRGSAQAAKPLFPSSRSFQKLEAKHLEQAEARQTDDDQVNRDDEIQEPRRNQDQNSRKQGDDGGNVRRTNGHRNISG